jgi:hypothetical protein
VNVTALLPTPPIHRTRAPAEGRTYPQREAKAQLCLARRGFASNLHAGRRVRIAKGHHVLTRAVDRVPSAPRPPGASHLDDAARREAAARGDARVEVGTT